MVDPLPANLLNRYYAMRHGQSLANAAGIVVSSPENGIGGYGLSSLGRRQVAESIQNQDFLDSDTRIVSSDFLRARETAEIARGLLQADRPVQFDNRLRERFFGIHEGGDDSIYPGVWKLDRENPDHEQGNVESTSAVQRRVAGLIHELEQTGSGQVYLLVAHGDPLQILQTAFAGVSPRVHREQPHLDTANIRELKRPA
jgi:probable phosphoglycerate mutase